MTHRPPANTVVKTVSHKPTIEDIRRMSLEYAKGNGPTEQARRRNHKDFLRWFVDSLESEALPVYSDPLAGKSAAKNGDCTQRTGPVEGEGSRGNNPESREPSGESPLAGKPDVQPSGQIPERSAKFGMSDLRTANLPLL